MTPRFCPGCGGSTSGWLREVYDAVKELGTCVTALHLELEPSIARDVQGRFDALFAALRGVDMIPRNSGTGPEHRMGVDMGGQDYTAVRYSCGCTAAGVADVPTYCPCHGSFCGAALPVSGWSCNRPAGHDGDHSFTVIRSGRRRKKLKTWTVWIVSTVNDYTRDRIVGLYWTEAEARAAAKAQGEYAYPDVEPYEIAAPEVHG